MERSTKLNIPMLRYLPLIFKNSWRNRRRSILTICSVAASMCLLGVLFAMYGALFLATPTPAQALRLVTYHRVSLTQPLPISYGAKIRAIPGVRDVSIWQWFGGVYKDSRDPKNFFGRFAVEPEHWLRIRNDLDVRPEQADAFIHNRTACIAAKDLADKFGWKIGEKIMIAGDVFPANLELTLVGIYDDPDHFESLEFNQAYLYESLPAGRRDLVGAFQLQVTNPDMVTTVSKTIDQMFDNSSFPTKTESESAFALSWVSFIGNVKFFLLAICGAVTFTILLVSANTMAMSVRERIREVGILKTLGYRNNTILGIILGEAAIISLIGGAIGLLLASMLTWVVRQGPAFIAALKTLSVTPGVAAFCLAFAVFVGLISSIIPASGAARTSILDALRSNA